MTFSAIVGLLLVGALLCYLVVALIEPDRFT